MTLDTYLESAGITDAQFAERTGLSVVSVWRLRTGNQWPRRGTAKIIANATGGVVRFGLPLNTAGVADPEGAEA